MQYRFLSYIGMLLFMFCHAPLFVLVLVSSLHLSWHCYSIEFTSFMLALNQLLISCMSCCFWFSLRSFANCIVHFAALLPVFPIWHFCVLTLAYFHTYDYEYSYDAPAYLFSDLCLNLWQKPPLNIYHTLSLWTRSNICNKIIFLIFKLYSNVCVCVCIINCSSAVCLSQNMYSFVRRDLTASAFQDSIDFAF